MPVKSGYKDTASFQGIQRNKKKINKNFKKRHYYLFLTVVLVICLFQAFRGAYLNIARFVILNQQFSKLKSLNAAAQDKNINLKRQLKNFSSSKGIEALARDNLNMVGKNEVLVVIKQPPPVINKK